MTKIAIIGAGFCGLAAAWHLLQLYRDAEITLLHAEPIGSSASGIAAGLLHPFAGAHAKRNWQADAGMAAALELFAIAEKALNQPVVTRSGLLRLASTREQLEDFALCQKKYPAEVQWRTSADCQNTVPRLQPFAGIFIERGMTVDCPKYLLGMYKALSEKGVSFEQRKVTSLNELHAFDLIIATAGAGTTGIPELQTLPLKTVKGQLLELAWPQKEPPLPFPLNSHCYLLMAPHSAATRCIAGATFEREYASIEPAPDIAIKQILPKIQAFYPGIHETDLIACRAALRSTTPDHLPILKQISKQCWVLAGMGSKGLLYHALYAKELCSKIKQIFSAQTASGAARRPEKRAFL